MTLNTFFHQVFEPLPRQGPGCTGAQTWDLTALTAGTIPAVDNPQPFLDVIAAWTRNEGRGERVWTVNASKDAGRTLPQLI